MSDRQQRLQQAMEHVAEAQRLIEENKTDIESEVNYMKGLGRGSDDFRKLSEQYECHEGMIEGLQKALFNMADIIW